MIEVKAEASDLNGLASTLVLPRVDAGVENVEDLIVAREQRAAEDLRVLVIDLRLHRMGGDDDRRVLARDLGLLSRRNTREHQADQSCPDQSTSVARFTNP